ncbi:MAG TPA: replication-associated recombination protein A [Chloroflexota bacterium]|nr:replication-associated recombination protein A [Chloroflexota bacterium]
MDEGRGDHRPLAARMRPRDFDEFVGQEHILGKDRVLRRTIDRDTLTSIILWGPPGTGKTTLAEIIASRTNARFIPLSAVSAGVADLRKAVEAAQKLRSFSGQRTVLFVDEIHRFNKAQQDAILPYVESGEITLIGATTENPSFEVNSALLSRCRVFRLDPLSDSDVGILVRRALEDDERGLGGRELDADDDALDHLVRLAGGDARIALTALEMAADAAPEINGRRTVTTELVEDAMQRPALLYDKTGDMHYHLISAYIKSVRGSDPDAAVYWLARMLEAGEDPLFITRRMIILAAEDVGLADPAALSLAVACQDAVHSIGMPEGYLPLTECTLYLAAAPKSNSALVAYGRAQKDVAATLNQPVPLHLRNAVTGLNRTMGYGKGYRYAHDFDGHHVEQQYLPDALAGRRYYSPTSEGAEDQIGARVRRMRGDAP